ncbi:MAG: hypothetical protein ABI165_16895, partial [Bryobacteraceae bacterium]
WPVTVAGTWNAFQTSFDKRAQYSTAPTAAGGNLSLTVVNGKQTIAYDPTSGLRPTGNFDASGASLTRPNRGVATDPSGACTNNNEVILSAASGNLFSCSSGVWHAATGITVAAGAGAGHVAVLNAQGNLDPSAGVGNSINWNGYQLNVPGSVNTRFNNNGMGDSCSSSLALNEQLTNTYMITLTGNCALSSGGPSANVLSFLICQDSGGSHSLAWPANYHGAMTVGSSAGKCSAQVFFGSGTQYYAISQGVVNQ